MKKKRKSFSVGKKKKILHFISFFLISASSLKAELCSCIVTAKYITSYTSNFTITNLFKLCLFSYS